MASLPIASLRRSLVLVCLAAGSLSAPCALAADGADDAPASVRVERVRPSRPKLPTLRFLKTNRDFLRSRLDLLREKPLEDHSGARDMDPRFLAYRDMVASARTAGDSVAIAADADQRRQLFASVTELGTLENQLDQLGRLLADQRMRLTVLQEDFTGHQRSALAIVLSGAPAGEAPAGLAILRDDGTSVSVQLSDEERASLAQGGVLEISHALVEPREQVFEIAFEGGAWSAAPHGYVTLAPERDRLTFLRLDLTSASAASGAAGLAASTWIHAGADVLGSVLHP